MIAIRNMAVQSNKVFPSMNYSLTEIILTFPFLQVEQLYNVVAMSNMSLNMSIGHYQSGEINAVELINKFQSGTKSLCDQIQSIVQSEANANSGASSTPML